MLEAWVGTWLTVAAVVVARAVGLAITAPGWATPSVDWRIRVGLVGVVAVLLAPALGPGLVGPISPETLARVLALEVGIGAILGLEFLLVLAAARQAGDLVGQQVGLSAASLFDPEAGEELTPIGHLYGLVGLGLFLALDGPARLVGVLMESYRAIPPGGLVVDAETARALFGRVGWSLELALRAAAPVAIAMIAAGLVLGLLTRGAGSIPFANLMLPMRSLIGIVLVLLALSTLAVTLLGAWDALLKEVPSHLATASRAIGPGSSLSRGVG